jgi:RNA polymerase sigma factor (sigma-70 family)
LKEIKENNPMSVSPRVIDPSAVLLRRALSDFEVPLTRYAVSILGDIERSRDAVQDTFVKLYEQDPEAIKDKVKAWLFTVCRNRCYDILKKERRVMRLDDDEVHALPSSTDDPAQLMARGEDREKLNSDLKKLLSLIEELPDRQREVMRLKFQADLSYKEIGEALDITVSNVGYIVHSAFKKLREAMNQMKE